MKRIAGACDRLIVVGSPNSSNSVRLVEVAKRAGCPRAMLVQSADEIDWNEFIGIRSLGITAGASAPEVLVDEIIDAFKARFAAQVESVVTAEENVAFKLPRQLRDGPSHIAWQSIPRSPTKSLRPSSRAMTSARSPPARASPRA